MNKTECCLRSVSMTMAAWPPVDLVICWLVVCSKCIYPVICLRRGLDNFPRLVWSSLQPRLAPLPEGWGYRHAPPCLAIFLPLLESWEKRLLDPFPCSFLSLLQYFHHSCLGVFHLRARKACPCYLHLIISSLASPTEWPRIWRTAFDSRSGICINHANFTRGEIVLKTKKRDKQILQRQSIPKANITSQSTN